MPKSLLKNLRKFSTLLLIVLLLPGTTLDVLAATLSVDTLTDTGGAGCELREATVSVNGAANSGGCTGLGVYGSSDAINFSTTGTITLTNSAGDLVPDGDTDLDITVPVVIDGPTYAGAEPDVVIDANSTGRAFDINNPDNTTVEINDVTLTNGNAAGGGLGFLHNATAGNPKTLNLNRVNLDDGAAAIFNNGGALHTGDNNIVNLTDTEVSNSTTFDNGGGIYVGSGTELNINTTGSYTDNIHDNSASNSGGAIYVEATGTTTIENIDFEDNSVLNSGGAIHYNGSGTSTITNSRFKRNIASQDGGAISNYGTDLTIDSSTFGNATVLGDRNISNSEGGAIFAFLSGDLDIQSSAFYGNRSDAGGGAIKFSSPGALTVEATDFVSNQSMFDSGGAVSLSSASLAQFTTVTFGGSGVLDSNIAWGGDGGAIYSTGIDLTLNEVDFERNSCSGDGGAVNFIGTFPFSTLSYNTGTLTSNSSSGDGGALNLSFDNAIISSVTFNQNAAQVSGGAISLGLNSVLDLTDNIFNDNYAVTGDGGAIFSSVSNTINATDTTVSGNYSLGGNGGFLAMTGAVNTINFDGTNSFTDNQADAGGAMYIGAAYNTLSPPIQISNSTFTNNEALSDSGGAICLNVGSMRLDNVDFNGNNSLLTGGALFLNDNGDDGSTEIINGSNFIGNFAGSTYNGGAIYLNQNLFTNSLDITQSNFDLSNATASAGGAIHNENGTVSITNSSFTGAPTMNVDQGGAINNSNGTVTINDSSLTDLSVMFSGGAIMNTNGVINLSNSTVSGNQGGDGAALVSIGASQLNIDRCYIGENDAAGVAGGIAVSVGDLSLVNSTVENNTAVGNGGGIYVDGAGVINIISSTIAYNDSLGAGGGIFASLHPSPINFQNSILEGNTAVTAGPDCHSGSTPFSTAGFNLFSNTLDCGGSFQPGDVLNASAQLGPLALYGGTTLNYTLSPGSPSINTGDTNLIIDQRGVARPQGAADDIGSHELQDVTAPVIAEVTPVPTPTTDPTPDYTFSSTEAGTITFGGGCSSSTTSAVIGDLTITFDTLTPGTYSLCTITVTDIFSNISNLLAITSFTITSPPTPPQSGGAGSGGSFGQPACSGSACTGGPTPPPATPPTPPPPVTPPVTPPTTPPPVTPPATPPTTPSTSPTNTSTSGTNSSGLKPATSANPGQLSADIPPSAEPVLTETLPQTALPTDPEIPSLRSTSGASISSSLIITTPEAGLKSADDTPFILGEGPANIPTDIYLFDSQDFDEIRAAIQKNIDEKYPDYTSEQKTKIFQQQFTSAVISILDKFIHNNLDSKNPLEAKFINRVLKLGTTITGNNKLFLLDSEKKVRDNTYLMVAYQDNATGNQLSIFSKEVEFTVDSTLNVLTPEIKTLGGKILSADALIGNLRIEIDPGNLLPTLVGRIKQPSKIVANWQSDISTSALIADSLDEDFRLSAPAPLSVGEHSVYVTAYRRSDNAQSQTLKINFLVSPSTPLNVLNYWWLIALILLFGGLLLLRRKKSSSATNPIVAAPVSPIPPVPSNAKSSNMSSPTPTAYGSSNTSLYKPYIPPSEPATIFTPTSGPHSLPVASALPPAPHSSLDQPDSPTLQPSPITPSAPTPPKTIPLAPPPEPSVPPNP